jgi:hypothetical protein
MAETGHSQKKCLRKLLPSLPANVHGTLVILRAFKHSGKVEAIGKSLDHPCQKPSIIPTHSTTRRQANGPKPLQRLYWRRVVRFVGCNSSSYSLGGAHTFIRISQHICRGNFWDFLIARPTPLQPFVPATSYPPPPSKWQPVKRSRRRHSPCPSCIFDRTDFFDYFPQPMKNDCYVHSSPRSHISSVTIQVPASAGSRKPGGLF